MVFDAAWRWITFKLDSDRRRIEVLDEQNGYASRLAAIEEQRFAAGVGTRDDLLRARLLSAQIRLKRLHIQDDIDVLRERLAHLTGLPADSLETETRSIPPSPDLERNAPATVVASLTAMNTEGVRAAYASAQSRQYQAFGDARQVYRPQIGFGSTYSRFSEINNYQDYYKSFQHNNFEAGLQITVPLFDASKRAKERESVAEATRATAQADQARDQSSENIVLLQKSLNELAVQKEVAQLQSELAQSQLDAVLTQINSPSTAPGATPLTPREEQQARIEERRRAEDALDANFELMKAELGLLRATGQIEKWCEANGSTETIRARDRWLISRETQPGLPCARFRRVDSVLVDLFHEEYRALRPRAPVYPLQVRFAFDSRYRQRRADPALREGAIKVSLSDLLEGAPEPVLRAIAHILLAKLYRKPIEASHSGRYRRFASSDVMMRQTERMRQSRGRKRISSAQGETYDLDEVFESLNSRFFHGLLGRPLLTWSEHVAKRCLGHYDAAHNTIMVSKVFDRKTTPRYAVEYLMYHEMLHLKHPVRVKAGRRCVHSRDFKAEEDLFPELGKAMRVFEEVVSSRGRVKLLLRPPGLQSPPASVPHTSGRPQ